MSGPALPALQAPGAFLSLFPDLRHGLRDACPAGGWGLPRPATGPSWTVSPWREPSRQTVLSTVVGPDSGQTLGASRQPAGKRDVPQGDRGWPCVPQTPGHASAQLTPGHRPPKALSGGPMEPARG